MMSVAGVKVKWVERTTTSQMGSPREPSGIVEDDDGGGGDGDADEGVEGHGDGKSDGLAGDLGFLGVGVAGEVGDVEGEGGPEADHAGEGGEEEGPEVAGLRLSGREGGGLAEHGAESAGGVIGPGEEDKPEDDEERRFDVEEDADGLNAAIDDERR